MLPKEIPFEGMIKDITYDLSSLGSLLFFSLCTLFFVLTGHVDLFWFLIIGHTINYLIIVSIRLLFFRQRPIKKNYHTLLEKIDASSFPSGHSARSVLLVIAFLTIFPSVLIQGAIIVTGILVCISRVLLKKHYWTDIWVGAGISLAISMLLLRII